MLPAYVLLDLETTGATPLVDRITEIALIRIENGQEVSRWQTLVNPDTAIPPFIQRLTGIDNDMVATAPRFQEVAGDLLDYLDGAVLCAHNVRFDHGFLKNEFKRMGIDLRQKVLCTVKLSRKLYPQHRSHSLDSIIERHGLQCGARHRAMGDVVALVDFLHAAEVELGPVTIAQAARELLKGNSLPSGIDAAILDDIPEGPGVYLFYGDNQLPLYIGKSINLRSRVLSHFSGDHASTKEMRISQEVKHIEWIETAGEFGALMLESRLVKERQPIYNRQLRRERQLCSWRLAPDHDARPLLTLVREEEIDPAELGQLFGTFRSKRQAVEVLRQIAENHALCPKVLGLESGKGPCFAHQLRKCKGVCAGKEASELHYLRLQQALAAHRMKSWPYPGKIGIHEQNPLTGQSQLHVFEHWCALGSVDDEASLHSLANSRSQLMFDLDTYKLLVRELAKASANIRCLVTGKPMTTTGI
jgi:DNA polymerase III subunit epsilon